MMKRFSGYGIAKRTDGILLSTDKKKVLTLPDFIRSVSVPAVPRKKLTLRDWQNANNIRDIIPDYPINPVQNEIISIKNEPVPNPVKGYSKDGHPEFDADTFVNLLAKGGVSARIAIEMQKAFINEVSVFLSTRGF